MSDSGRNGGGRIDEGAMLAALAVGASQSEAAKAAGCSVRTVRRRIGDPEFRAALAVERDAVASEALAVAAGELVTTLRRLAELRDQSENLPVSLGAAKAIMAAYAALRTEHDLSDRLAALELALSEGGDHDDHSQTTE